MILSLIVGMDEDRVIGQDGAMPWHLPADLKHFKQTTLGKPLVMGRRTFEAIGKALPGRRNIVLTRNRSFEAPGCEIARSLDQAIELCADAEEVMIVGGAAVYEQALPRADRIYLTRVHGRFHGDTRFPAFDHDEWEVAHLRNRPADERNPYALTFIELHRRR